MRMKPLVVVLLAGQALAGCWGMSAADTAQTGETGPEGDVDADADSDADTDSDTGGAGDTTITQVDFEYDSTSWYYGTETVGRPDLVTLDVTQDTVSPWEEDHDLPLVNNDGWYYFSRTLDITTDWQAQESDVNTLFPGNSSMAATMIWRVRAWDNGSVEDCVVWAGSAADADILMDQGCRPADFLD